MTNCFCCIVSLGLSSNSTLQYIYDDRCRDYVPTSQSLNKKCNFLHVRWRYFPMKSVKIFDFTGHVFGIKVYPICANKALLQTGRNNKYENPQASKAIYRNFCLHEFAELVEIEEEFKELYNQVKVSLTVWSFILTKWISTISHVMNSFPTNDWANSTTKFFEKETGCLVFARSSMQHGEGHSWSVLGRVKIVSLKSIPFTGVVLQSLGNWSVGIVSLFLDVNAGTCEDYINEARSTLGPQKSSIRMIRNSSSGKKS